jgi:uncharacterized LabA/DUF88 family protein
MDRGRTILFVDNSNVFKGSQNAGWRIDAKKLFQKLEEGGKIWQTFFFAAVSEPPRYQQTNFYKMLKQDLHFEMIVLPLGKRTINCGKCGDRRIVYTEKGVDVALATKLLVLSNNRAFDTAILLSGDKDYLEIVKEVKSKGLRVEVVAWRGGLSHELADESSSEIIYLDDIRNDIELTYALEPEVEKLLPTDETSGGG